MSAPVRPPRVSRVEITALAVAGAALLVSSHLDAQSRSAAVNAAARGTSVIAGRAVDGATQAPVAGVSIGLSRNPDDGIRMPGRQVIADAQGRFAFPDLPAGQYAVTASRQGWTMGVYGVDRPRPPEGTIPFNLTLQSGQRANVTVPVWHDALLSGRITTESGEPLGNARVYASQWTVLMGRRRLSGQLAMTDDRGAFSIRVQPGDYLVSATSDDARARGVTQTGTAARFTFATTYFPSSPTVDGAGVVTVKSGEERTGLDISLPLIPARRVTGTLRSVDGAAIPTRISITSAEDNGLQRPAPVGPGGRFVFDNIPPGRYVIATLTSGVVMTGRGNTANDAWVSASIDVDAADIDVTVDVHRSVRVSGHVRFDTEQSLSPAPVATVTLTRDIEGSGSDVVPPSFPVDSDGRFSINVTPGRYIVSASGRGGTQGWMLRSAISGGRDVADVPLIVTRDVSDLELTLTTRTAGLGGRVTNLQTNTGDVLVLLFPTDDSLWTDYGLGRRQRVIRPGADGSFSSPRLPGGEYFVSAVQGASLRDWRGGALFDVLAKVATRVTLEEGVVTTSDLRMVPAPAPTAAQLKPAALPVNAIDVAAARAITASSSGGSISGRVIDAETKGPISGMRLSLQASLEPSVYSDEDGRFLIADVPAGQHMIYTLKAAYVATIYGARRPDEPGTPVALAAGQHITDLVFPISRGASIAGTVVDEFGVPMSDVEVGVRQMRWQPQGREGVAVRLIGRLGPATTDSRGEFRIYGLAPGDYVVDARSRTASAMSPVTLTTAADLNAVAGTSSGPRELVTAMYAPVSYPSPEEAARGSRLRLSVGEERTVALQMQLVPVARVRGIVRNPGGEPMPRIDVQLLSRDPAVAAGTAPTRSGSSDSSGAFIIDGVRPGRYTLMTRPSPVVNRPRTNLSGALDVTVNGDVDGVVLNLTPEPMLSGRIRIDASGLAPQVTTLRLEAIRMGEQVDATQAPTARWNANGEFSFVNLLPGRYRLTVSGPRGTVVPTILSQTVESRDTLSTGIELKAGASLNVDLVVSGVPSQLSGRLETSGRQLPRSVFVILFGREAEAWAPPAVRVFAAQPDQNGRFTFRGVPPGEYWVTPLTDAEPNGWFDPDLLKTLVSGAQALTVTSAVMPEIVVPLR